MAFDDLRECQELWVHHANGQAMAGFINGDLGWLTGILRFESTFRRTASHFFVRSLKGQMLFFSTGCPIPPVSSEDLGLMHLRYKGDAGRSSRNPRYDGPADATRRYKLDNGQVDEYPLSWAIPVDDVRGALRFFEIEGESPSWIPWHDDSSASDDPSTN